MYNLKELLNIYKMAFEHNSNPDVEIYQENEIYKNLAEFAHLISCNDVNNEKLQNIASNYLHDITWYHDKTIKEMEEGTEYKRYPCRCLIQHIENKIKEINMKLDEMNEDDVDTPEWDKIVEMLEEWEHYKDIAEDKCQKKITNYFVYTGK